MSLFVAAGWNAPAAETNESTEGKSVHHENSSALACCLKQVIATIKNTAFNSFDSVHALLGGSGVSGNAMSLAINFHKQDDSKSQNHPLSNVPPIDDSPFINPDDEFLLGHECLSFFPSILSRSFMTRKQTGHARSQNSSTDERVSSNDPLVHRVPAEEVFCDDAVATFRSHGSIPDALGINDHPWSAGADLQAGGLGAHGRDAQGFEP